MSVRPHSSERAHLAPFIVTGEDIRPRDQRDLMERPFFSLSKSLRTKPILYKVRDVEVQVLGMPEHGMATIWDADVLIWAASQIVEAANNGFSTSRFFRFTPYHLLAAIGRARGATEYRLLKNALARLQSTVVATTIRHGEHWRRQQFSWINEWEEMVTRSGRIEGMEFVLPEWLYRGVLDRSLVLAIDPAYFRLTGGIERWLYRIARKHAGQQPHGWTFEIRHLHAKSGSLARVSDFALDLRHIAARQPLPGYRLRLEHVSGAELLHILPAKLSTGPVGASGDKSVGNPAQPVDRHVRSGARNIGISGAALSGYQAHEPPKDTDSTSRNRNRNLESNKDSNLVVASTRQNGAAAPPQISRKSSNGEGS
jgi:plasmid replication initiation protein